MNSVNEQPDADKAQATNAFFNGSVEESPSPYHIPLLDDDTGFGDIREDAEDFPELWKHIDDAIAREEAAAAKASQAQIKPDNNIFGLASRAQARKAKQAAAINVVQEAPVVIDLTGDENGSETSLCKSSLDLTSHLILTCCRQEASRPQLLCHQVNPRRWKQW